MGPPAIPFGDCLSKRGAFAAYSCFDLNDLAKFPCSAASSLCPAWEARVSRLIGKFDTTASGRKWQVAIWVLLWQRQ